MQTNKLITIMILLTCIPSAYAWTDEQDLFTENETCEFNVNPIFNTSTVDNPYWFEQEKYLHGDKDILSPYFRSNDVMDYCMDYDICKYVWDSSTSSYVKSACCITITECITCEYKVDANGDGYYALPDNFESQMNDGFLIKRYFQEMLNSGQIECSDFTTTDDSGDNPDVFGINASADVGNTNLNAVYTGYVTLTGESEKLMNSQGQDYGFDMDSIGGEGGSGALANQLGLGELDEGSLATKGMFNMLFYAFIPVLFILLWMKMSNKVMK